MIPVFSEWTQLQIQEAEKKQVELTNSTEQHKDINETLAKHQSVKMRQKNYASPDCGAKVLASNPEAQSTSSVLTDKKDEYLLSPCTARIWFVVELCDSIQAQRVELANFELFSSPLKSVSISVTNRFPTREWIYAGQFDANSERDVQVIELSSNLFGKFVRVDLTYTNTEHYCPLSFFRIFGTSEIEAFEVENEPIDRNNVIDDEEEFEQQTKDKVNLPNKDNLLNRAGAAVMSIVHKAAEALAKTNENDHKLNETSELFHRQNCVSLSHTILCHRCSENEKRELNEFMSCKNKALSNLLSSSEDILNHLLNSEMCSNFLGFNLISADLGTNKCFITSILPWKYIAAMCNLVATNQKSLALRVEDIPSLITNIISKKEEVSLKNVSKKGTTVEDPQCHQELYNAETTEAPKVDLTTVRGEKNESPETTIESVNITQPGDDLNIFNVVDQQTQQVTTSIADNDVESIDKSEKSKDDEKQATVGDVEIDPTRTPTNNTTIESNEASDSPTYGKPVDQTETKPIQPEVKPPQIEIKHSQPEIKPPQPEVKVDPNELKLNGDIRSSNPPESVFLRLSTRIKTLEKNMSLSSQYLEELSRRYKKQIEEVQLSFSKLQASVEDQNHKRLENDRNITRERKRLNEEMNQMSQKMEYMEVILFTLCAFLLVQTIFVVVVFRRISIYRKALGQIDQLHQNNFDAAPSSPTGSDKGRTGRKRSKQRTRKISAPNILTQRSNGHSTKNEFPLASPILCRTVSAPNKVNTVVPMKEDKENYDEMKAMLEENDDILIPGFEDLKVNDGDELENKDFDTASTASAVSNLTKNETSSIRSFKFKRRLSSPFQLKKSSIKKSTSDRSNEGWTRKAASESPASKSFQDDDGSVRFKKSNSFKKLFKKLF